MIELRSANFAAFAVDGEFIAYARVHRPSEIHDVDWVYAEGAVLPAARGRGLGRRMLEWADERAAGLHLERHPDIPGAVCVGAHENNPSKQALVRAAGYEATRWEHKMTQTMDEPLPDAPRARQASP